MRKRGCAWRAVPRPRKGAGLFGQQTMSKEPLPPTVAALIDETIDRLGYETGGQVVARANELIEQLNQDQIGRETLYFIARMSAQSLGRARSDFQPSTN